MDYYKTKKAIKLEPPDSEQLDFQDNDEMARVLVQPVKVINEKKVLSQAQNFRHGLKISQELASLVSEGGMPTFTNRYELLKNVIKYWKLGVEVELLPLTETGDTTRPSQQDSEVVGNLQTTKSKSCENPPESAPATTKKSDGPQLMKVGNSAHNSKGSPSRKSEYDFIKMPSKIRKRGRPKGAELTVIGLPNARKVKMMVTNYYHSASYNLVKNPG